MFKAFAIVTIKTQVNQLVAFNVKVVMQIVMADLLMAAKPTLTLISITVAHVVISVMQVKNVKMEIVSQQVRNLLSFFNK